MKTFFIADLHLKENQTKIINAFYGFLKAEIQNGDTLYILGDLFEVWVGDDEHTPLMDEVALSLTNCAKNKNCKIYYLHGNRDFMLGKRYAKQASMQLLPEHHEIVIDQQKILILHGDTLCLDDVGYQKMRRIIQNSIFKFIFKSLPLYLRKKIGWKIKVASQNKKRYKTRGDMGVTQSEVERLLVHHHCLTMIHGHTHSQCKHSFLLNGAQAQRFDVGDWYHNLSFVVAEKHKELQLVRHPISFYND
ncbi:MAG: UDP-2,3-diacylglucosamine diphosphatase [Psychromonas sp.]|nr:UDP-2,3-diacylglucosamine diphosphatase [Psychromonas sp.]